MAAEPGTITPLTSGDDNYQYLVRGTRPEAFVVDPGDATSALSLCSLLGLKLTHILLTHAHADHTAGVTALVAKTGCTVVANTPQSIAAQSVNVDDGSKLVCAGLSVNVIHTPGHTADSCCYYVESLNSVFTGDTLFLGGCGRLLGGTATQLYESLQKLAALPEATKVWCGHEYTLDNLVFACSQYPDSAELIERDKAENAKFEEHDSTIPGTIGEEIQTNVFMQASTAEEFAALRAAKDRF